MSRLTVLTEVLRERERQDEKWGEQNHPDGTTPYRNPSPTFIKQLNDIRVRDGSLAWKHILEEEVEEAFFERDPQALRAELIQVSAVAVAWVEAIDRRTRERTGTDTD